MSIYEAEG